VRQKDVLTRLSGQDKGNESRFNQDIQIEQKKIDDAYKRLEVLDADVKAYTDQGSGFLKGDNVKRGLEVRKSQQPERDRINQQITVAQENINKLRAQINSTLASNTVEIKAIEKNISRSLNSSRPLIGEASTDKVPKRQNHEKRFSEPLSSCTSPTSGGVSVPGPFFRVSRDE